MKHTKRVTIIYTVKLLLIVHALRCSLGSFYGYELTFTAKMMALALYKSLGHVLITLYSICQGQTVIRNLKKRCALLTLQSSANSTLRTIS